MSPEIISLIGILVGLVFFMVFAVYGWNIIILGIGASVIAAIFGGMNVIDALTVQYSAGFVGFWQKYMLLFLGGALFARLMTDSGAAFRIAGALSGVCRKAKSSRMQKVLAVMTLPIINGVLTYGGITSFLVVFLMVAIARQLFEELDIPWKMYGCACLGSATFTAGMLPGSPSTTNLIPMSYLGTTPTAGATLGILASLLCVTLGTLFIIWEVTKAEKKGEGFMPTGQNIVKEILPMPEIPNFNLLRCLAPCIILLASLNLMKWSTTTSLFLGCMSCIILFFNELKPKIKGSVSAGLGSGIMTLALVCAANGFGAVVSAVPGYAFVLGGLKSIPGPAALQVFVSVNIAAGITGSAQGGLAVCLSNLGEHFLSLGIPAGALHRLCSCASIGLDTLPHSVGVINAAGAAKLTHKEIYYYFFVITVVITMICALFVCLLITLGIGV